MQPHEERVVAERDDLHGKIDRLAKFMDGEVYQSLAPSEQGRLIQQLRYMTGYREALEERIAAFTS